MLRCYRATKPCDKIMQQNCTCDDLVCCRYVWQCRVCRRHLVTRRTSVLSAAMELRGPRMCALSLPSTGSTPPSLAIHPPSTCCRRFQLESVRASLLTANVCTTDAHTGTEVTPVYLFTLISCPSPAVLQSLQPSNPHTHTRLTALCPGLPRWASTRKVKPIWILLKQQTVSGSGISWAIMQVCTSLQTDNHSYVFTGRMPNQQRQSTEGKPSDPSLHKPKNEKNIKRNWKQKVR